MSAPDNFTPALPPLLLIEQGEWSDREVHGPFRVLKRLNFGEAKEAFVSQYKPANEWDIPGPEEFEDWLIKEGYIDCVDSFEVHIGSYGELKLGEQSTALTIDPAAAARKSISAPEYEWQVFEGDEFYSSGSASTLEAAQREAGHYAAQIPQDIVEVRMYVKYELAVARPTAEGSTE